MVKVKNKNRNNADTISQKKDSKKKKKLNPFEVHINNEKLKVLGRKLKNDRGLPGVSRSKAMEIRKRTLLPEYNKQHKENAFCDKRIGEGTSGMSMQEKNLARYTALRVKQHKKKSIFNLADDEILTHRGQTLSEIEKFDDPKSDEDDEVDDTGKLDSKFVEELHFGGGMLKKVDESKSHKDLIEQLIMESKKRKAEMQKQKENTMELTQKLDSEWKDLLPIVSLQQNASNEGDANKTTADDYDKVMRALKFEARGTPSNKLKTEAEIAREQKETLEKLENERLERMRGVNEEDQPPKHRSADDLDCNYANEEIEDEDVILSYNVEGIANIQDSQLQKTTSDEEQQEENESEDDSNDDSEDNFSDLKEESESDEEEQEEGENEQISIQLTKKETSFKKTTDAIREDLLRRKEMMERARNELPFTFSLPSNYEELATNFEGQSPEHQGIIVERMIKCNHPSLKQGNRDNLGMLFVYLLQHLNDVCTDIEDADGVRTAFKVLANLTPHFYDLTQQNPYNAATSLAAVLKEKHDQFQGKRKYPGVEVLLFLKLIGCLFSTSDFRHHVVTPAIIFIEQLLIKSRVKTKADIAYGLFLVCIYLEYTALSKRYLPASLLFLNGVIHSAIPKTTVKVIKVQVPFRSQSTLLLLTKPYTQPNNCTAKLNITHLFHDTNAKEIDETFKHDVIHTVTSLLKQMFNNFKSYPSCYEIFDATLKYIKLLPLELYDKQLQKAIEDFVSDAEDLKVNRKLEYCQMDKKKPKALRLYEPTFERIFDEKKHKTQSRVKAEREKLLYKVKKARKGALKEIRRDRAFLGRVRLGAKLQSDAERREKVKRIYSEAAAQQSELNSLDRSNKRKKK